MLRPVERYSSIAGRKRAGVLGGRIFRGLLIALLLYLLVTLSLASTFRVDSASMEPALRPSDRVVASFLSYGPRIPFTDSRFPGLGDPERGDMVVVRPPFFEEPGITERIFEPLVGFFTGQKVTLRRDLFGARVNAYMVKRVVGVPGDTVRLSGNLLSIKPRGASTFLTEEALLPAGYHVQVGPAARGWDETLPLSGSAGEQLLGPEDYYLLGDNRDASSDSRSWGPLTRDRIVAKVIYRYWPPESVGAF